MTTDTNVVEPTPGPWTVEHGVEVYSADSRPVADCSATDFTGVQACANARLIAAAPDHALVAGALVTGVLRYEPFANTNASGELCFNGLRHATGLDEFGVPRLTDHLRALLLANARGAA